jgi:hypothetical protein
MKLFTRIVFGFNTLYQASVGFAALLFPEFIIGFYQGTPEQQGILILRAAFRAFGFNLIFGGIISAIIAKDPVKNPLLLLLMASLSVLTMACWLIAWGSGEMNPSQFAFDIIVQIVIVVNVALMYPIAKRASNTKS